MQGNEKKSLFDSVKKIILLICFIAASFCISPHAVAQDKPDCDINAGHCIKKIGDAEIILDITPKPVKVMRELFFTVTLKGKIAAKKPDRLIINLEMPGMYMGRNEVVLERISDKRYQGKGVIPRCPSGRKLWRAEVYIPHTANGNMRVDFLFNVS